VEARWREIRFELSAYSTQYPHLLRAFDLRMPIQVLDIYFTAFHLDSLNIRIPYTRGGDD
jgi:hypothetical protein